LPRSPSRICRKPWPGNIGISLAQLPEFSGSRVPQGNAPTTTGATGVSILALRGLGAGRTLTLVNGQRAVSQNASNTFDVSLLPTPLIQRVEIVTGGASAAYGSDAVGGVVNIILDTKFEGLKGHCRGGNHHVRRQRIL